MASDFVEWFVDTITVESPQGLSATGTRDQTWGNRRAIAARVSLHQKQLLNAAGETVTSSHLVRCGVAIDIKDRVWLPGATVGVASQAQKVLAVSSTHSLDGSELIYRVYLGV